MIENKRTLTLVDKTKTLHLILLTAKGEENDIVGRLGTGRMSIQQSHSTGLNSQPRLQTCERMVEALTAISKPNAVNFD
jgi:hypothetical protein